MSLVDVVTPDCAATAAAATDLPGDHAADRDHRRRQRSRRQAHRRVDRERLHRHGRQRAAGHRVRRIPASRRPGAAAASSAQIVGVAAPAAAGAAVPSDVPSLVQAGIAAPPAGDARFRNRRLIILFFDLSQPPGPDQERMFAGALKYLDQQMTPADLVAIMTYTGGAVRVKQDFTDDRTKLGGVIDVLANGEDKDGDGVPDFEDFSSAFGQNDGEFNVFSTDRQLAALQTAVAMLRPLPEQKSLVYFTSRLSLSGTDNNAQMRATTNAAVRANVQIFPWTPAASWRGRRSATPISVHPAASACSPARSRSRRSPASSNRRTRCSRWRRTQAARRSSTTTTCRSASARPPPRKPATTSSGSTAGIRPTTASSAACRSGSPAASCRRTSRIARATTRTRSGRSRTASSASASSKRR